MTLLQENLSFFGVYQQVMLKSTCSATETSKFLEIMFVASLAIILSRDGIIKTLIRLHGCTGLSASSFVASYIPGLENPLVRLP